MTTNRLGPQLRGLSHAEAAHRLTKHGPNALPEGARVGLWQRLIRQFKSALIYILLLALILDLVLWVHEEAKTAPYEAMAIALILVLNAGFGAYQEGKAERRWPASKHWVCHWYGQCVNVLSPRFQLANSFRGILFASRPETECRLTACWPGAMG